MPSHAAFDYERTAEKEVEELVLYRRRLHRARDKEMVEINARNVERGQPFQPPYGGWAGSVPLATLPCQHYARLTKRQLAIPEPHIPFVHNRCLIGYLGFIDRVMELFADRLRLPPRDVDITPWLTLTKEDGSAVPRDRVVSTRYIVDTEEPDFGMRTTANMIIDSVEGIWKEWNSKVNYVKGQAKELKLKQSSVMCQIKPIKAFLVREAFMLEFMAWNTGAGFIHHSV
jgi:hypothetical protein